MTFHDWLNKYRPILNPYCNTRLNVRMFETYGEELDHVHKVRENNKRSVWTLVDSNSISTIIPGYHHINRLGYFITEVTWDDELLSVLLD